MNTDHLRQARARQHLHTEARRILYDPNYNVTLVDYGAPVRTSNADDRPTLRFHVDKKRTPAELEIAGIPTVPRYIGEFTTDIVEGRYQLHTWSAGNSARVALPNDPTARYDPLRGGVSISDLFHYQAGTLGGLVRDRVTQEDMILSNFHVLVVDWFALPGKRICQPGRLDGGVVTDIVATLVRHAMSSRLDAAVAKLTGSRPLVNDQLQIGPVTGVDQAQLGMQVKKFGRTSLRTDGVITGVDGVTKLNYSGLDREIRNVVTIVPQNPLKEVSAAGDSGSWWLNVATNAAVALHFAGGDRPERALGMDMQSVLDALNVDIVTASAADVRTLQNATSRVMPGFTLPPTAVDPPFQVAAQAEEALVGR